MCVRKNMNHSEKIKIAFLINSVFAEVYTSPSSPKTSCLSFFEPLNYLLRVYQFARKYSAVGVASILFLLRKRHWPNAIAHGSHRTSIVLSHCLWLQPNRSSLFPDWNKWQLGMHWLLESSLSSVPWSRFHSEAYWCSFIRLSSIGPITLELFPNGTESGIFFGSWVTFRPLSRVWICLLRCCNCSYSQDHVGWRSCCLSFRASWPVCS